MSTSVTSLDLVIMIKRQVINTKVLVWATLEKLKNSRKTQKLIIFSTSLEAELMLFSAHYEEKQRKTVSGTHKEWSPPNRNFREVPWTSRRPSPRPGPACSPRSGCILRCWCGWACWGRDSRVSQTRRSSPGWAACRCTPSSWGRHRCRARWCWARGSHPRRRGNTSGAAARRPSGRGFWPELWEDVGEVEDSLSPGSPFLNCWSYEMILTGSMCEICSFWTKPNQTMNHIWFTDDA